MSTYSLSQFVKLAFDELVQKYPRWHENDRLCIEHGCALASSGAVRQVGENLFEVNHDQQNRKTYVVNRAAQACNCPAYIPQTTQLDQTHRCKHRIAVYLHARALELRHQFDAEWREFLCETCDGREREQAISDDELEYLIALAESKAWHAAQTKKAPAHRLREQLPLPGTPPSLDDEQAAAMSRLQHIRRTYVPVVDLRIVRESKIPTEAPQIKSPSDAAHLLFQYFAGMTREHMVVMTLNQKNRVTAIQTVYVGSVHTTVVRIGELFQLAVYQCAPALIIAHNHPSGDPTPSPEDAALTREIVKAGKLLDIDLLDHLVVGDQRFVSLKERNLGFEVTP
jgi:hypothetical protein